MKSLGIQERIRESTDPIKNYVVRWTWTKSFGVKLDQPKYKTFVINEIRSALADAFARTAVAVAPTSRRQAARRRA